MIMNGVTITPLCPEEYIKRQEDIHYPTVEHITYFSTTTGLERGANVVLPADYDTSKRYPVLYILHGIFGNEHVLLEDKDACLTELFGNLTADGLAKEAVIVFPHMYATSDPEQQPAFQPEAVKPYDNFINDLVTDLIPFIESKYSVYTDREHRALAGFSMGGRETLFIGFSRPDLFAYLGAIAPAPGVTPAQDWAMKHEGQMKEEEMTFAGKGFEPRVLMVCCGSKDGTVGQFPFSYHSLMEKNGVAHTWYEVPDADHNGVAIRAGLYNYLQAIFR